MPKQLSNTKTERVINVEATINNILNHKQTFTSIDVGKLFEKGRKDPSCLIELAKAVRVQVAYEDGEE